MPLQPPSVLLQGPSGTGKTYSVSTLVAAGIETFFIGTEPNAADTVIDAIHERHLDIHKFHYHSVVAAAPGWDALETTAAQVKNNSHETLTKLTNIAKDKMEHWVNLLKSLKDFPDDQTGIRYGDCTTWGPDRALVLDGLSGLNKMAREYTVGYKPTMHVGEWGVAMQLEENLLYKLVADRSCFFVLICHVDREIDEITGASTITASALGRKLAPQLIKYFSEIVYAKRTERDFVWSTNEPNVVTKFRSLGQSNNLNPSFVPLVEAYKRRAGATPPAQAQAAE